MMTAPVPREDIDVAEVNRVLKEEEMKRKEPMLERYSHAFGKVQVYAPFAPVASWKDLPWTIKVERYNADGPKRLKIKADCIMKAYESPGLIESHKYEYIEIDSPDKL